MKTAKKKSNTRAGMRILSTSEARANFAEALETARADGVIIGFDRYGRTVAALVPVEAVYVLAGMSENVSPAVRASIKRQAASFIEAAPNGAASEEAPRAKKAVARKKPAARKRGGRG